MNKQKLCKLQFKIVGGGFGVVSQQCRAAFKKVSNSTTRPNRNLIDQFKSHPENRFDVALS